jgi:hypothetical protein
MQHQSIKYFRLGWIILILCGNLFAADANSGQQSYAYLAYAPGLLMLQEGQFQGLPRLQLGSKSFDTASPATLLLHGLNAGIFLDENWRAGAKICAGGKIKNSAFADSIYWNKMFIGSSALFLEYAMERERLLRFFGSLSGGLLFLRFETQAVFGTPAWSSLFQYPNNSSGMNSISARAAFFLQPAIGIESSLTETILLRFSAGILISRIGKDDWQLNQSLPLADGISVNLNQPYFQLEVGLCR